jgi:hypothetical protein
MVLRPSAFRQTSAFGFHQLRATKHKIGITSETHKQSQDAIFQVLIVPNEVRKIPFVSLILSLASDLYLMWVMHHLKNAMVTYLVAINSVSET